MPSVQSVLDALTLRVKIVDNSVGVGLVTGSEHHQFEIFCQLLNNLLSIRPDINRSQHRMPSWKSNRNLHLVLLIQLLKAVN